MYVFVKNYFEFFVVFTFKDNKISAGSWSSHKISPFSSKVLFIHSFAFFLAMFESIIVSIIVFETNKLLKTTCSMRFLAVYVS